jgi:hypothetical protein
MIFFGTISTISRKVETITEKENSDVGNRELLNMKE